MSCIDFDSISKKPIHLVISESIIVGLFSIFFTNMVINFGVRNQLTLFFTSGFILHLFFEYTGVNMEYSRNYCKFL
jgi:hypothetical protein